MRIHSGSELKLTTELWMKGSGKASQLLASNAWIGFRFCLLDELHSEDLGLLKGLDLVSDYVSLSQAVCVIDLLYHAIKNSQLDDVRKTSN